MLFWKYVQMGLCYFSKGSRKFMVVLPTKSLESPALQSEFQLKSCSLSFCSEKLLGDPEAHVQIGSRKGKRGVNDGVLNMSERKIWTRGNLEAQSNVCLVSSVSSLPAGIQLVSDPVSYPQIYPVQSGFPSRLGTPWVLAQETKQERLAGPGCPVLSFSPFYVGVRAEASPPCSVLATLTPVVQTLPAALHPSRMIVAGLCCGSPAQVIILFAHMHVYTRAPWTVYGSTSGHAVTQNTRSFSQSANCPVGARVQRKPDRKSPFPLGTDFPLGR